MQLVRDFLLDFELGNNKLYASYLEWIYGNIQEKTTIKIITSQPFKAIAFFAIRSYVPKKHLRELSSNKYFGG